MDSGRPGDASSWEQNDLAGALRRQRVDELASLVRGGVGGVPWFGPIVAEVLATRIPNQRIDRIADVLIRFGQKLEHLEESEMQRRLETPEAIDLLEDGLLIAGRALTEERRERIASLMAKSLTLEELEHLEKKTLFQLLDRLNDAELIILQATMLPQTHEAFYDQHADVLYGVRAHLGSSQDDIDRAAIQSTYRRKLRDLGLIEPRFKPPRRGELPEFDVKTGMIKASGDRPTVLGRLLLRYLDLEAGR